jgi:hypothetical protein
MHFVIIFFLDSLYKGQRRRLRNSQFTPIIVDEVLKEDALPHLQSKTTRYGVKIYPSARIGGLYRGPRLSEPRSTRSYPEKTRFVTKPPRNPVVILKSAQSG